MKRKLIQNINNDNKRIRTSNNSYICLSNSCKHNKNKFIINYDDISSLDELIILGNSYSCKNFNIYKGINLRILNELVPVLQELNEMVGLSDAKEQIITHILYFIRGLAGTACGSCIDCELNIPCIKNMNDMFHTVITGPPGVGKTTFAKILGRIYCKLGKSSDKFNIVSRSQLVSGYLGRTAKKTQKVINKSKGGVLFKIGRAHV